MNGYPLTVNVYAKNEAEVADARVALIEFIDSHAKEGRAVTAQKIANAARSWNKNVFIKNKIIDYFS